MGVFFYKRSTSFSAYVLADRQLGYGVTALSAQASDMSGWLLMGLPGYAFLSGVEAIWIAVGLALGTWVNWNWVAKRIRVYSSMAGDSKTIPAFLEHRFNDSSHIIRLVTSFFILVFFLIYTASGFVAGAKLFASLMHVPYLIALLISALIIVSYTFLGGFNAVSWTDFVQGSIMFMAVVIVPVLTIAHSGGIFESVESLRMYNPELLNPFTNRVGDNLSLLTLISLLAWGLGYFGQPHILARFMAINDARNLRKSKRIAMIWVIISLFFALLIGLFGIVWFQGQLNDPEKIFLVLVQEHFSSWFSGFLLAAVLAAVMSTADSQLLVTSTSLTEDIYAVFFRKTASDKELLLFSRFAVLFIAVLAFFIAASPNNGVLDLVSFAWGGFGASLGPVILFSLYYGKTTKQGALWGIISGGLVAFVWKYLDGGIFDLYEIVPGFFVSCGTIFFVSFFTQKTSTVTLLNGFEKFKAKLFTLTPPK